MRSCSARSERPDHRGAGDAPCPLHVLQAFAEVLEVLAAPRPGSRRAASRETRGTSMAARTSRAGSRTAARAGDRPPSERCVVRTDHGEPVVVVGALRAVGRHVGAEGGAERQRGREVVAVEPHERVAEAVHAAVALPPRGGPRADAGCLGGAGRVDVARGLGDHPVGEAGAAAGVVAARQVVHEVREGDAFLARVGAPDGVHHDVAVREHPAALARREIRDRLHAGARVVSPVDDDLEALREALPRRLVVQTVARREVERAEGRWDARARRRRAAGRPPRP